MSLGREYLSLKQWLIWGLKSEGYTETSIERKRKIRSQPVYRTQLVTNRKFFMFAGLVLIVILAN
jgi:hypothetical protein